MPVVAVFNMKGGVGKTTVSAHLVHSLAQRRKKRVLVVDLDPQFNLTQLLMEEKAYEALRNAHKTVLSIFQPLLRASLFDAVETPVAPPPAAKLVTGMDTTKDHAYDLIVGDMEVVRYGLMRETEGLAAIQQRFLRFISQAKKEYDGVFLDCNPSGSFLTTCAIRAADRLLVPVRPDRYSYLGLGHVSRLLDMLPDVQPKPPMDLVMNGESRSDPMSDIEREIRGHGVFGRALLAAKIYHSSHFKANSDRIGFAMHAGGPWSTEIRGELMTVADEYATRLSW